MKRMKWMLVAGYLIFSAGIAASAAPEKSIRQTPFDAEAMADRQINLVTNPEYVEILKKLRKETLERHAVISSHGSRPL